MRVYPIPEPTLYTIDQELDYIQDALTRINGILAPYRDQENKEIDAQQLPYQGRLNEL